MLVEKEHDDDNALIKEPFDGDFPQRINKIKKIWMREHKVYKRNADMFELFI